MIISYPTGLYRSILPANPQDAGNVTFTISNNPPPRTNLVFPKIPVGLVDRGKVRPPKPPLSEVRKHLGELIFSVSTASRTQVGNNSKQYELGQVLEFDDAPVASVDPMLVSQITETQHNTNVLDYDSLGVSEADQTMIATQSLAVYSNLTDELNNLKQQRIDAETIINVQQKIINEANRTISALTSIVEQSPNPDIQRLIDDLVVKRTEASAIRDQAITDANLYSQQANVVIDKLRSVAVVLK